MFLVTHVLSFVKFSERALANENEIILCRLFSVTNEATTAVLHSILVVFNKFASFSLMILEAL